ncbi:MAG: universal stress protein [Bacteroidota bacterium]
MSLIIATTDFSDASENAVHYACSMAKEHRASVIILHSFMIPITISDTPIPVMPIDEGMGIAERRMKVFVEATIAKNPGVELTGKVMYGDIIDCLEELTEKAKPWFIVFGNNSTDNSASWLGSTAVSALKHLAYNVIAIPQGVAYKPVQKICFACDLKNYKEHVSTQHLIDLVQATGAQLHILNVDHNNKNYGPDSPLEETAIHGLLKSLNPEYHFVDNENTDEAIQQFVDTHKMDWLVVVPQKHLFFENLFHKSHTKAMVKMSHIPLVALHDNH